jgi:hypothetical protein
MFDSNVSDGTQINVRVSFVQSVKAGLGFSLGAVLLPAIAVAIQMVTKIQLATLLTLLHVIR